MALRSHYFGFFCLTLICSSALSKNLESKVGFGINYRDFNNLAAASVRYYPSHYIGTDFSVGFDTEDKTNALSIGAKIFRNAHLEENLNFYVGLGAYMISDKGGGDTTSTGIELDGFLGAEFFLSGLPNLGLQFEVGVALRSIRKVSFKSVGASFAGAGIHYYF